MPLCFGRNHVSRVFMLLAAAASFLAGVAMPGPASAQSVRLSDVNVTFLSDRRVKVAGQVACTGLDQLGGGQSIGHNWVNVHLQWIDHDGQPWRTLYDGYEYWMGSGRTPVYYKGGQSFSSPDWGPSTSPFIEVFDYSALEKRKDEGKPFAFDKEIEIPAHMKAPVKYRLVAQLEHDVSFGGNHGKVTWRWHVYGPHPWGGSSIPTAGGSPTPGGGLPPPQPPPPPPPAPQPTQGYRVVIDGQVLRTSTPPTEVNGRVLVGLADIFRALGAGVSWDGGQKKITTTRGQRVIELWIGRKTAIVDGRAIQLDVPPLILAGGSTYVPVRFVSQALGAAVDWRAPTRSVLISTSGMPPVAGAPHTPFTPAPPPQGLVDVRICRESGLRAVADCPNTVTRQFVRDQVPGPCTTHTNGPKLIVDEPTDGARVPVVFELKGTCIPRREVLCTVVCEATWLESGAKATSTVLPETPVTVGKDGKWALSVDTAKFRRDKRVRVERLKITCLRRNRQGGTVEQVDLTVLPGP